MAEVRHRQTEQGLLSLL